MSITRVQHVIGIGRARQGIAVADMKNFIADNPNRKIEQKTDQKKSIVILAVEAASGPYQPVFYEAAAILNLRGDGKAMDFDSCASFFSAYIYSNKISFIT